MRIKSLLWNGIGIGISQVLCRCYICYNHILTRHYLSNEIILMLNVFPSLIIFQFLIFWNHNIIFAKQRDRSLLQSHNHKIQLEFFEPNSLFCCFTSNNVLDFQDRVSNTRLLHTTPTNGSTTQGKHIPWSGPPGITIKMEVKICITSRCQIITMIENDIISRSTKILEYTLFATQWSSPVALDFTNTCWPCWLQNRYLA